MNNKDFISKLAEAIRYTAEDAQTLADTLIDALKQQIDGEQQLVVSDFARFYVEKHYEYIAEDEKTGKRTLYPPKLLLCYETLYQVGDSQPQITAPEVANAVAAQRNISQGEADMLLHQFFLSLLSAINTEKTVKVKGLGQFRLAPKKEKDYFLFTPDNALRDFINEHLPQLTVCRLEGTYLPWVDVSALGIPVDQLCDRLLTEGKVWVNPGTMYGPQSGEGYLRVNLACPRSLLMEALERIKKVI